MRVNKVRDFIERTGWTAIQAAAAALITALSDPQVDWNTALRFVATTAALAALKVIVAQQVGNNGSGDAIPGGVEK